MKVFIANFGEKNYLWPKCQRESTIATVDNVGSFPFWKADDRTGYIEYALRNLKTARMQVPTRSVASRWFGLNNLVTETSDDIWVHREKDQLWWTISKSEEARISLEDSFNPKRDGPKVYEFHKPCILWSNRTKTGASLSWNGLHPKAKDFLFTEGSIQQISEENAKYAIALLEGDRLDAWHTSSLWRIKEERSGKGMVKTYGSYEKTIWRMVETVSDTIARATGQMALTKIKEKHSDFDKPALEAYLKTLFVDQDGLCAITGIVLQLDDGDDIDLRCSLDRIDSDGHYEPGNLQIVCRFINKWKGSSVDADFRRLVDLIRSSRF